MGRADPHRVRVLQQGLGIVEQEPDIVRWFAVRFGPPSFGIDDAFPDDSGRHTHLSGEVAHALENNTGVLFPPPTIEPVDVVAEELPV